MRSTKRSPVQTHRHERTPKADMATRLHDLDKITVVRAATSRSTRLDDARRRPETSAAPRPAQAAGALALGPRPPRAAEGLPGDHSPISDMPRPGDCRAVRRGAISRGMRGQIRYGQMRAM
jgi:hypothetical protein